MKFSLVFFCIAACSAADLTGNWAAGNPGADGVSRKTYFDLKQDGARITGHKGHNPESAYARTGANRPRELFVSLYVSGKSVH